MENDLSKLVYTLYANRDSFDSSTQNQIKDFLKNEISQNNGSVINDLLKNDTYDKGIDRRVDLSWIKKFASTNLNNPEKAIRMNGLIRSYKDAADTLVMDNFAGPIDFMFQPIMFCYFQYIELLLKNFKQKVTPNWRLNSHEPKQIWDAVKSDIKTYLNNQEDYDLVDNIITCLFDSNEKSSMCFRYLEDLNGSWYIGSDSYSANLYSVMFLMDIVDDILRSTYDGDLVYQDN